MIGKIKGRLIDVSDNIGLIETSSGISYEVFLTSQLLTLHSSLPTDIEVFTYLYVRDDALILFGFQTKEEYRFFKMLLGVSGVGPKTAFSIISCIPLNNLISSIRSNDADILTQVPGLGRKTAMKIILELSTKIKSDFDIKNMILSEEDKTVIEALVSLGFKVIDAKKILRKLPKNLSLEDKIKKALKEKV